MNDQDYPLIIQVTPQQYEDLKDDKVAKLTARIAELEAALRPFALIAEWDISDFEKDTAKYQPMDGRYAVGGVLKIGDFRRALAALEKDRAK